MNKKTFAVFAILLLAVALLPLFAKANEDNSTENNDIDEENEENEALFGINETEELEIEPMASPYGAMVRLLELEKSISRNILVGENIVEIISARNSSLNVTHLNRILDEMELLLDEVKSAPTSGEGSELAQKFVDMKHDAIALSKEFREYAKLLMLPRERAEVAKKIKDLDENELQKINKAIRDAKHEFNAQYLNETLQRLGLSNENLIKLVQSGNATIKDVMESLKEALKSISAKKMNEARQKIKESESKRAVHVDAANSAIISNRLERMSEREMERSERLENQSIKAEENGNSRAARVLEHLSDSAEKRSENLEKMSGNGNGKR
ncbi:MAG: hypothetical protein NTV63_03875 [Candidatus Woesearchaeota archaeon]|nr:hypothetical protein [Candidatus Woesearchaeota archaeon]